MINRGYARDIAAQDENMSACDPMARLVNPQELEPSGHSFKPDVVSQSTNKLDVLLLWNVL